jgi:hypothetical protein
MRFQPTANVLGVAGFTLAAMISANAFGQNQATNYGPPATSYISEAARYPDAATKPTPRTADGHPDLNGVWHHYFGALVAQVGNNSFALDAGKLFGGGANKGGPVIKAMPDPAPAYKPEYVAKVKMLNENQVKEDGALHCRPPGVPRVGPPQQIVMTPKQAVFLYADITGNYWRVVQLDGRGHNNDPDLEAMPTGDSIGHWEGDTLVVDVTRLSDDTWRGNNGLMHSNKLHVIERLKRVGDTIQYQMTAEDPQVLAKPWTITRTLTLQSDTLQEAAVCVDNDAGHLVNLEHHDNGR